MPGPFTIDCPSYNLAQLATVMESNERDSVAPTGMGSHAWIGFAAVMLVAAVLAWLARRRWPLVTVLLYTCWIVVVFMPLLLFLAVVLGGTGYPELGEIGQTLGEMYRTGWWFWVFCGVMVTSQLLLLTLPIRIVKQRPVPRRTIWSTASSAALFFSLIIAGAICSLGAALLGDEVLDTVAFGPVLAFWLYNWLLWAWIFRGFGRNVDAPSYLQRLTRWIFRGSILELLVAVPSHIIIRHRDVCCAHGLTALGIATGLTVMLISFGPGVYFLYAQRIRRSRGQIQTQAGTAPS